MYIPIEVIIGFFSLLAFVGIVIFYCYRQGKKDLLTDQLTGAGSERALKKAFARAKKSISNQDAEIAWMFLDLDDFGRLNKLYGDPVGDEMLKQFVNFTESILRPEDMLFRKGGDEFMVALYRTNITGAEALKERLQKTLDESTFTTPCGAQEHVKASIGIVKMTPECDFSSIQKQADREMRRNKKLRKNLQATMR